MNIFDEARARNKNTLTEKEKLWRDIQPKKKAEKKTPQPIPESPQRKGKKTTGSKNKHKLDAGAKAVQEEAIKTNAFPQAVVRFNERLLNDGVLAPASIPYQIATGKKLLDFGLEAETDSARKGAAVGNFLGSAAAYGTGYGAAGKAIGKGAGKVLATDAAKKATAKLAASKIGQKAGKETVEKVAEGIARNVVGDATVGTLMNLSQARGEGLEGKELTKDMALNAAMDFGLGNAFEFVPMAWKAGKNAIGNTKVEPRLVDGKVKNVRTRTPEPIPQKTYKVSQSGNVNQRLGAKEVKETLEPAAGPQPIPQAPQKMTSSYINPEIVPEEKAGAYRKYIDSTSEDTKKFVESVRSGKISKKAYRRMGGVTTRESEAIKQITGIDAHEYEHILPANTVEHIDKRHGKNGLSDQSMANLNDVSRIEYVIHNFDEVEPLKNSDGSAATTGAMQGTDQKAAQLIRYKKRIDGHYYIVEAVAENKKKQLRVISAYIEKAGNNMPAGRATRPEHAANLPPQVTSETPNAMSASYDIIPENPGNVKQAPQPIPHADTIPEATVRERRYASDPPDVITEERWKQTMENAPGERAARSASEEEWAHLNDMADERVRDRTGVSQRQIDDILRREDKVTTKTSQKAQQVQNRKIREADQAMKEALGINKYSDNKYIKEQLNLAMEKMKDGSLTRADKDKLFNEMFAEGIVIDQDFALKYQDLKQAIRGTQLNVPESVRRNITDFDDFRKSHVNKVRMSNTDGANIDIFYDELRETYPEIFPELNTREEMLEKIADVADSIKVAETRVSADADAEAIYAEARKRFDEVMDELDAQANIVKRFVTKRETDLTTDEMLEFAGELGKMKRNAEKVKSKILLSDADREFKDMLLKGKMTPEEVRRASLNSQNIFEVYTAEKPVYEMKKAIKAYGQQTKDAYSKLADDMLGSSDKWKDKIGFAYARETPERNFVDIAGKDAGERINKEYFEQVHEHEAAATKMKNVLRDEVRKLKVSTEKTFDAGGLSIDAPGLSEKISEARAAGKKYKISEAEVVQLYGEGIIDKETIEKLGADFGKIQTTVDTMRKLYNQLLEAANNELLRHGYEPIEFRKDYFPHFSEEKPDGILAKAASALGIDIKKDELPTDINGLTHTFRPGKKWFGHALQRTSKVTEYDAIKGFDIYLEGISDVIHHTEDIQKLRALENELRFKYSDDGMKDRIREIKSSDLDDGLKEELVRKVYDTGNTQLGSLATWIQNYTDQLAGKKSQFDRVFEQSIGRTLYNTTKAIENRVAANMVALNPGSWLTNFIPLVQAGELSPKYILQGMAETVQNGFRKTDDLTDISAFLTNRKGSDVLWKSGMEKIQDFLTKPMELIDTFTSQALVRAKYAEQIAKGVNPGDAIKNADRFAADIIADRSKGALPTVFNSKNPVSKIFTMYQVEVNNQWSHLLKDIPRSKENVAKVAMAFTNFAIGAYIFNDVYERFVGRRPALDPISWVNDFVGDTTGKKLPNFTEALDAAIKGEDVNLEEVGTKKGGAAVTAVGENIAQDIPFVGGILGGGRVPISSAIPDFGTISTNIGNLASGDVDPKKAWFAIGKEAAKPATYILPPVGGGQIKKAVESGIALKKGGSYGLDNDGQEKLRFAVDSDAGSIAKGLLFGQYAIGNSGDYVESGFKMLSPKKTKAYQALVAAGMKNTDAEKFIRSLPGKTTEMRTAILNSNLTAKQKQAVGNILDDKQIDYSSKESYSYSLMTDNQKEGITKLKRSGMSEKDAKKVYEVTKGNLADTQKVNALLEAGYHEEVMKRLGIGDRSIERGKALHAAGIDNDIYTYTRRHADANGNGDLSKKEVKAYLDKTAYTRKEKFALMKAITGCADKNNPYR